MIYVTDGADVKMGFAADEFCGGFRGAGGGCGAGGRRKAERTFLAPRGAKEEKEEGVVRGRDGREDHLRGRDFG